MNQLKIPKTRLKLCLSALWVGWDPRSKAAGGQTQAFSQRWWQPVSSSQNWLCFHNNHHSDDATSPCLMSSGLGDTTPEFTSLQRSDSSGSHSVELLRQDGHTFAYRSPFLSPSASLISFHHWGTTFPWPPSWVFKIYLLTMVFLWVKWSMPLLILQGGEQLDRKFLERRLLDIKELGYFLSRRALSNSYRSASVSDSSRNLIWFLNTISEILEDWLGKG